MKTEFEKDIRTFNKTDFFSKVGICADPEYSYKEILESLSERDKDLIIAMEIIKKRKSDEAKKRTVSCSKRAFLFANEVLSGASHEEFWALFMNRKGEIIKRKRISMGGRHACTVDVGELYRIALLSDASSLIVAHNHPSGLMKPSNEDIELTKKIRDAGTLLDIRLLDHIIVGEDGDNYFSFCDNSLL